MIVEKNDFEIYNREEDGRKLIHFTDALLVVGMLEFIVLLMTLPCGCRPSVVGDEGVGTVVE